MYTHRSIPSYSVRYKCIIIQIRNLTPLALNSCSLTDTISLPGDSGLGVSYTDRSSGSLAGRGFVLMPLRLHSHSHACLSLSLSYWFSLWSTHLWYNIMVMSHMRLDLLQDLTTKVDNTPCCHLRLTTATVLCAQPVCLTFLLENNITGTLLTMDFINKAIARL